MRKISLLMLLLMCSSLSCIRRFPDPEGRDARDMMSQTVKVAVSILGMHLTKDEEGKISGKPMVIGWTGSGVIVDIDKHKGKGESLIMTAAHVSNIPEVIPEFGEDGQVKSLFLTKIAIITVETLDGRTCESESIYSDPEHDLGVIRSLCIAGNKAELADELPPLGAMVTTSGAGLGYHPRGTFVVTDGRYVGMEDGEDPGVVVTLPAVGGHSGSGIFYRGKVFSILTRRAIRFEHIVMGTELRYLKLALEGARGNWD